MKLLYLMTEPFGIGGVQSDLLALSEHLGSRGHQVDVATMGGPLLDELVSKGARHVPIDFRTRSVSGVLRAALALRRLAIVEGYDVIAPQSVATTFVAFLALRLLGLFLPACRRTPIVTTIHNIHNPRNFATAGWLLRFCADYVIFESHYERNRLLQNGLLPRRSTVIHSGIDTERFSARPRDAALMRRHGLDPERHVVYGIVARLSEEKGHRYLVAAFAHLHRTCHEARLLIVGDGPLLDDVRRQVTEADLDDAVVFAGLQRDVPGYLSIIDVFVLASTRESFPLSAREAMAAGKPVIAPDVGGCGEVVDNGVTGLLFPSRDVGALAQAMQVMADPLQRQRFGANGRRRSNDLFSLRNWVEGDEDVYLRHARSS